MRTTFAMVLKYNPNEHELLCFHSQALMQEHCNLLTDYFSIKDFSIIQQFANGSRNLISSNIEHFYADYRNNLLYGEPIENHKTPTQLNDHLVDGEDLIIFFNDPKYQKIYSASHKLKFACTLKKLNVTDRLQFLSKRGDTVTSIVFWLNEKSLAKEQLLLNLDILKYLMNHFRFQNHTLIEKLRDKPLVLPWRKLTPKHKNTFCDDTLQSLKANLPIDKVYLGSQGQYLTSREFHIFKKLCQGLSTKTIARVLDISPKTVFSHIDNVKQKLSTSRREDLVKLLLDEQFWLL